LPTNWLYPAATFNAFDRAESEAEMPEGMSDDVLAAVGKCVEG
jgi:hypothetical protein